MFLFNCLTFEHKNALAQFQKIILAVVDKSDNIVVVYLDDPIIFRDQLDIVWKVAIWVIAKPTAAGL